ncbi:MAG: DNA polymerase III subunit epsilon [Gammaproteobacteria bacterium]|nr:MAG: DNA polymerase III subunit epsilon [Gammaproteobacteria bacterium]
MIDQQTQSSMKVLEATGQYKVLARVPETLNSGKTATGKIFKAAVIDLETTGLDPKTEEIIEIGLLIVSFTNEEGFIEVEFSDNQLQQPSRPITEEITNITGITNEDVEGRAINWQQLEDELTSVDLIICHNAYFDRNFMELQSPDHFSRLIKSKAFGCSSRGINWAALGFEGAKLEYLNLKMGFFYEGHRALVDCWATLNLFIQKPVAFDELKISVREKEAMICAVNAPFEKKDLLKQRGYRWSDGSGSLPKSWWVTVREELQQQELDYLKQDIYGGREVTLPSMIITARKRYSYRAQEFE